MELDFIQSFILENFFFFYGIKSKHFMVDSDIQVLNILQLDIFETIQGQTETQTSNVTE